MASTSWLLRLLHKTSLVKQCPADGYHWWWEQICWCRTTEYSDSWTGGVYVFGSGHQLHTQISCGRIVKAAADAAYQAGKENKML